MDEIKILLGLLALTGAPQGAPADPQAECVARVVYAEARGEPELGQALVASTVYNRSLHRKKLPCEVAAEPRQFAVARKIANKDAWAKALTVAKAVRDNRYNLQGCTQVQYFHEHSVRPKWAITRELVCIVQGHRFYREVEHDV